MEGGEFEEDCVEENRLRSTVEIIGPELRTDNEGKGHTADGENGRLVTVKVR